MEVGKMIGSYPFKFQGARILSGVEEGAYSWITINYLLSSFIKYSYEGKWLHPKNGKILGALNMGGASTQITFTPEGRIADKQTEASFRKQHSQDDGPPLLPHWLNTMLGEIFQSPCRTKPEPYLPDSRVMFTCRESPALCKSLIKTLFNCSACAGKPECSFDGVYQPSVCGNFFVILWHPWAAVFTAYIPAFSEFFYTFDFLKLAPQSSLDVKKKTTEEFCERLEQPELFDPYPPCAESAASVFLLQLKTDFPTEKENNLREYCATSYYITTILADAYKFDNQSWNKIIFKKKLRADDTDIGWMLGYTLNLTNLIPTETPCSATLSAAAASTHNSHQLSHQKGDSEEKEERDEVWLI
ncbi:UNVERIFIED_CONTAM: hypothetical protein FKN15_025111 [Acipenser sinensis]